MPHQNLDAVPFTPLTAEFLDNMNENIESLARGTGLEPAAVKASNIDFATFAAHDYSTAEVSTGRKWTNGRMIYQKSLVFSTTGSGAEETGANNETFDYISEIIYLSAVLNMPNGERYPNGYTNPSAPSVQYFQLKFANWDGVPKIRYQTRSVGTVSMTILYTKN